MGLALEVGMLADLLENDEEGAKWFKEEITKLNTFLSTVGLRDHNEPDSCNLFSCDMFGYSGIHYLRRLAAHLNLRNELPEPGDDDSSEDPILREYFDIASKNENEQKKLKFNHLILHSDAEGYYLPQDFEQVLFPPENLEIAGGMVGSSQRLLLECESIAKVLELPLNLDPESDEVWNLLDGEGNKLRSKYGVESFICLRLHHAANHSIQNGAAIVFC